MKYEADGSVIIDEELMAVIKGFIEVLRTAGKYPIEIYVDVLPERLTALFLQEAPPKMSDNIYRNKKNIY